VERAFAADVPLVSRATLLELQAVLLRDKFARYVDRRDIDPFLNYISETAEQISTHSTIRACRHAKDNKFLELAVDGQADLILTGDQDLLALHPFRGIAIITPMQYLAED
jgi:putative PIN family toxin of toxin-antitoxin system